MIKRKYYKLVFSGFMFGVFMWFVDSFIDSVILNKGNFIQSLFPLHYPHQHEFFYRMLLVVTFTLIGFIIAYLFSRHDVDISNTFKRPAFADLIIGGFLITGLCLLIFAFGVTEKLFSFFQDSKYFLFDEIFLSIFIIIFSLLIFAYRRWSESLIENSRRVKVEENLRLALRKAEDEMAKTESILSGMGEAVSMQNLDFKVMYQNKAHIDLIGEHFGEYCYKAYQKRDKVCAPCHLAMAFEDGKVHSAKQARTTDDGVIYYEIVGSPLMDSAGRIIAGIEMVRDVTENVQRERMLAEQASIASLRAEAGTSLTHGYPLDVMLQKCCESVIAHLDVAFARIWTINNTDNMLELQASAGIYTHLDGEHSRIPVGKYKIGMIAQEKVPHVTNNVIGDPRVSDQEWARRKGMRSFAGYPLIIGGDVIGVLGVFSHNSISDTAADALRSVSDEIALGIYRNLSVLELTSSENDLRNLFESVNDAVFIVDMKGNFIDINSTAYKRLGYTMEEMLSMHISELEPPEFAAKVQERLEHIAKHGKVLFESAHIKKDGTVMPVEVNSVLTIFKNREAVLSTVRDLTDRKIIENELAQSRLEWEDTFNNISDIITIHDKDFNIIRANRAALEILHLPQPGSGEALKCYKYYHGTSSTPGNCVSCESVRTGKPSVFETYEPLFDKHLEIRAMPRFAQDGKIIGVSHIVRDISERKNIEDALMKAHDMLEEKVNKRTEELQKTNEQLLDEMNERFKLEHELQESEQRYRRFFEDSPTALLEVDLSIVKQYIDRLKRAGVNDFNDFFYSDPDEVRNCAAFIKVVDVNTVMLEIYKASSKMEFLENPEKAFCDETIELFKQALIAVADDNFEFEAEGLTQDFSGRKNHVSIKWSVQSGSEKTLSRVLVALTDITERRKAEDALLENERRLRAITDSTTDLIWEGDTKYDLLNWFGNIDNMLGYEMGEFPRTISGHQEHVHPKDRSRMAESIEYSIKTGSDFSFKYRIRCKDGTYRIWDERGSAVGFEDGKPVKWIGSITDITEKTRLEEEKKFMQAKLLHANKMTALGTLVSGVAHEINNPNAFIMTNAELLSIIWKDVSILLSEHYKNNKELSLGGLPYSDVRSAMPQLLKGISEGAVRIKLIIDNLKDYSRPEKINLDEDVDINEVIRSSVTMLTQQIKRYTGHFTTHLIKNLPLIKGSRQNLEQVIVNLISNALQSLPDKESGVRVSTLHNKKDNSIVITIKDEGAGIPADIIDRIIEPFFTTKIETGGTGLGLYISYAIINEHNGSMKFESIEGEGTTVVINIPVSQI